MKHLTILIILLSLLNSCKFINRYRYSSDTEERIIKWYQKEIILPDSIIQFHQGIKKKICLRNIANSDVKVFSILGNDCPTCTISQLLFWDRFIKEYEKGSGFQLVLVYPGPNDYLCNILLEDLGIQIPVLLDENCLILSMNNIFENPEYHTLLLDSENKVQLLGDFSTNKDLKVLYVEEIEKRLIRD